MCKRSSWLCCMHLCKVPTGEHAEDRLGRHKEPLLFSRTHVNFFLKTEVKSEFTKHFSVHCQLSTRPHEKASFILRFLSVISQCPSRNISCLLNVIIQFSIRSNRIKHVKGSITLKPIQLLKTTFKKVGFSHLPPLFVISHFPSSIFPLSFSYRS